MENEKKMYEENITEIRREVDSSVEKLVDKRSEKLVIELLKNDVILYKLKYHSLLNSLRKETNLPY